MALVVLVVALVSTPASGAEFFVDPVAGSPSGDGSAADPWGTLQEVVEAGLIETQEWDAYPYDPASSQLIPRDAGAPVQPGDTLWLRSGYHGDVFIERAYNSATITIASESGNTPTLAHLTIRSASDWVVRGLSISPTHGGLDDTAWLLAAESHNWSGPVHDIHFEGNDVFSVPDVAGWTDTDWNNLANDGISAGGERITIRDNTATNVDFGISVTATDSLVEGNSVVNFSGDGLRGLGDRTTFQYNTVRNAYDVNDNHDDGFQSWSLGDDGVGTGAVTGIVLRGNIIVNYTDLDQPYRGTLQGIGCFDGMFVDWVIENNVILTDHWHGITLLGAENATIVNNTVVDLNTESPGPPWISIDDHKDGRTSTGVIRNNLATAYIVGTGVTEDHNLTATDMAAHFVDYAGEDLSLIASSEAVDAGSADQAPADDIAGISRPQGAGIDIGAYELLATCAENGGSCCDVGEICSDAPAASSDCETCCLGVCTQDPSTNGDDDDDDAAGSDDGGSGGCGCASSGAASGLVFGLPLLLLLGRRRRNTANGR